MIIDNATLLIGIGFSSASLLLALLIGWFNSRSETYLVLGATGMALIVVALMLMGLRNGAYTLFFQLVPFALILIGFSCVYAGARRFRNSKASLWPAAVVGALSAIATAVPLLLGLSGLGTLMLNATAAVLMLLCAYEHIRSDDQLRFALAAIGTLYVVTAISFACCALMLALDGNWVLSAPPKNWAEDFNSIMSLVGLTGIGAITLTLHHARAAHHHHQAANTDSLTGVLNRRALFDRFSNAPPGRNSAVLMFDLDHFKQINDRLGHAEGDRVLKLFSDVLQRELGPLDVISRIGGEEFCAVLIDVDQEKAKAVAERVRSVFADLTLVIEQGQLHATVSVGLAMFEGDEDFPALLNRADAALYQAKHNGRNQVKLAALRLVA
ncbi:GGDEF domain-containing protein [Devosia sp. BK]|uniref:GGDEF domain-containing protein n=1 Tax=unclassified Devosia TaxID=196773 RepID=UPI000712BFE8|nr:MULTISPECIES: GGDEF domain-containing protein [unclassified Devosia]KQN69984.1 hypothetical protein ASE94_12915 [Devosia sp. Leaf64]MDV3250240.1 GGDEF domain-containing protein [Devosia sp. BK]